MSGLHAYVDESLRPGRYLLACVAIEEASVKAARRHVNGLLLPRQRTVHFQHEGDRRGRQIITAWSTLPMRTTLYSLQHRVGRGAERARAVCLRTAVTDLQGTNRPVSLTIESRDTADDLDRATIMSSRRPSP